MTPERLAALEANPELGKRPVLCEVCGGYGEIMYDISVKCEDCDGANLAEYAEWYRKALELESQRADAAEKNTLEVDERQAARINALLIEKFAEKNRAEIDRGES